MNLQENILKKILNKIYILLFFFISTQIYANERWVIDKNLSYIKFEVPVLFAKNVSGKFNKIDGFVEIDQEDRLNNKAIFSVDIKSIDLNYNKYKELILSDIFFNVNKYPISVLDTKKFSYENEESILLNIELTIKGISKIIPVNLKVSDYSEDFVQVKAIASFSRNDFKIGTGQWSNTVILKDKINLESNIFLVKE
tara:strand:- start:12293 stop:12883 length:591 start_codon:yes stop_codon:yes gene_type:complete